MAVGTMGIGLDYGGFGFERDLHQRDQFSGGFRGRPKFRSDRQLLLADTQKSDPCLPAELIFASHCGWHGETRHRCFGSSVHSARANLKVTKDIPASSID